MKLSIAIILLFAASLLTAQNTVYWEGGTPGKETSWDEPRNWSDNRVPDEFTHVVIKATNNGHSSQPVVSNEAFVASLEIHPTCDLTIRENARIVIDGQGVSGNGIELYGGKIYNEGQIRLKEISNVQNRIVEGRILGKGQILQMDLAVIE